MVLCRKRDLFGKELLAIDGTRLKAVNSTEHNFTRAKLKTMLKNADARLAEYHADLAKADAREGSPPAGTPPTRNLAEKIATLQKRRDEYAVIQAELERTGESQVSLTDPDSRAMATYPKVGVGYNAQVAVDAKHQLIVEQEVTNLGSDLGQLAPTAIPAKEILGVETIQATADRGYYKGVDIAWMFAAYVNEDHPAIAGLLKEAQATGVVDGFDAYQTEDPGRVLLQVFAVWEALRAHGIKYSDIGTTTTESDSLYTLHVRFIEETLSESHANCVDASVMLASILRRMGLDTFLVLEPGHMFLGIYLDRDGKQTACLETTMLGDPDPAKCAENRALAKAATREVRQLKGWKCFNDALDSAGKEYRKHRTRFLKENDPEYETIDIASARWQGIAPIGYVQPDGSVAAPPAKQ